MAPKSDKHKSAAAAATSDNLEDLETGSAEALARTVKRLHELQTACLQETSALSAIVTSNKQATEVNAQTIKGVEGLAKDTKTELALTNARIETMSMKINTMDQRMQTAEKLLDLNKKVSECRETVSQRELNDSALFLALNGIEMSRPAKNLDLHNASDRKVVEDALEKALGTMASGFVLKRATDGGFLNIQSLNTPPYQRRNYSERVPETCRNTLTFRFRNRAQLAHFEKAIRKRLFLSRDERKETNLEHLDLNVHLPGKAGQLFESLLNAQAKVTVSSSESLAGWRLVWRRRYKSSNDMMLFSEVRAAKPWMDSDMKDFFYDGNGQQVRGQWTFLRNIDSCNPKRSFFPRLQFKATEETQNRKERTTSSQATTAEEEEGANGDRNRASVRETGARARKPETRSRSPRVTEIPDITEITDSQNEEEEYGDWNTAGRGKNKRGGNGGGTGRGRGGDRGGKRGKTGRGDPSQSSIRNFMDDSTPRSRLAPGGSTWA